MKYFNTLFASALVASVSAAPLLLQRDLSLAEIDALAPQFGFQSGVNPTGTGDCDGAVNGADGQPIKVPCTCPPPRDIFIQDLAANIAAGHAVNNTVVSVTFPTDDSIASQEARITAASITLQNLFGAGVGCPVASTTFSAQAAAVQNGQTTLGSTPASSTTAAPASSTTAAASPATSSATSADGLSLAQIDALAPQFGFQSGVNPTGTGDCDGAVNGADGNPIKVPCTCPPARDLFIQDLAANIAAGHAVNNTVVAVTFPTDDSVASQEARITAASITLQNLFGAGVGCPVASTTFAAQAAAIQNGQSSTTAAANVNVAVTTSTSSTAAAASSSVTSAGGLSLAQIDALAPDLGFQSGVNPTGTGDCDGAVDGADGEPIKVPCSCPPARDVFIQSLAADIAAGHAVHNPSVAVSFPTDSSKQSQITRIQASLVALQNLNGEGVGCPAASTTLSSQLKALTG